MTCVALYLDRTQVHTVETDFKLFLSEPHTALTLTTRYPLTKTLWFYDLHSQRQRGKKKKTTNQTKRDAGFTPTFTLNSWSLSLSCASFSTSAITPGDLENKRKEEPLAGSPRMQSEAGPLCFFQQLCLLSCRLAMKPREQLKQKSSALRQSGTSRATSTEMQGWSDWAACYVLVKAVTH